MDWLSRGVEALIAAVDGGNDQFDVVIVGSGYGGAVAASRLARAGKSVCVLERGREYLPGEFPNDIAHLPKHVRISRSDRNTVIGEADALMDIRIGKDVSALVGSALGGTSQLNAAVAEEARQEVFQGPRWPSAIRVDPEFLASEYLLARRMLGVQPYRNAAMPKKVAALQELNDLIKVPGTDRSTRFRPLNVAIQQDDRGGEPGLAPQSPCEHCGDCCSGCNYWAKNTLTMNYLPDAKLHRAQLFTGASVDTIARAAGAGRRWVVNFKPTARRGDGAYAEANRSIKADVVVLAAGAFGSTEILMRSRHLKELTLSDRLGSGFSCNGDTLSFAFDQDEDVNAIGWGSRPKGMRTDSNVGPMAAGLIDLRDADRPEQRIVIEDGAIPGPLAHAAGELLTTAGLLAQLSSFRLKGDCTNRPTDPLAVSQEAMERTQVFLVMGHDSAGGRLEFGDQDKGFEGTLQVNWPDVGEQPLYRAVSEILDVTRKLGATHIPNPLWKPLPDAMGDVLSGPKPKGSLVTVHPLGGCCMGDDVSAGVVDAYGQVYSGASAVSVHDGLYVMDGSIVPSSLGINPLLTITALAERNVRHLADTEGWRYDVDRRVDDELVREQRRRVPAIKAFRSTEDSIVDVRMRELMRGHLRGDPAMFVGAIPGRNRRVPRWATVAGWLGGDLALYHGGFPRARMSVRLELEFPIRHVLSALQSEARRFEVGGFISGEVVPSSPPPPTDEIHWWEGGKLNSSSDAIAADADDGVPGPLSRHSIRGHIDMLHRDHAGIVRRILRALRYWWRLRGEEEVCREIHCPELTEDSYCSRIKRWAKRAWSLVKLAAHAGERRFMVYRLGFTGADGVDYELIGKKTIAFADGINVWRSLVDLDVTIKRKGALVYPASGLLTMDFLDAVRNRPPQIERQPNALAGWSALASIAMFVARLVIKTYLWHFRAPDYPPEPVNRLQRPGRVPGILGPEVHRPVTGDGATLLLSRYRHPTKLDTSLAPLVVTHGFAHSCAIFTAPTLESCLVKHLCEKGFDVWLLDLRTSTALPSCRQQWTFDAVAEFDIPCALQEVVKKTGASNGELNVLAHCMGAAVFSMGVLQGRLAQNGVSIRAAVLSQVTPYIVGSPSNQLRAELRAFLQDAIGLDHIDVSAHETTDWLPLLADRIACTYPLPGNDRAAHSSALPCPPRRDLATCNRITAVYGRNWLHENIDDATHAAMGSLLGYANMRTFRQINDFIQCGRIVFEQGINEYFLDEAIQHHMGFPMLFLHGGQSDVFNPETSRKAFRRFTEIHRQTTYGCIVKGGYGHLDLWLGRNAHRPPSGALGADPGVYHHVSEFFKKSFPVPRTRFARRARLRPATFGPLIGWTGRRRMGQDDQLGDSQQYVRVWWEVDSSETDCPRFGAVFLVSNGGGANAEPQLIGFWPVRRAEVGGGPGVPRIPLATYCVADVEIEHFVHRERPLWFGSLHLPVFGVSPLEEAEPVTAGTLIKRVPDASIQKELVLMDRGAEVHLSNKHAEAAYRELSVQERSKGLALPSDKVFQQLTADGNDKLTFLLGSCRYPGTMFEAELADRVFATAEACVRGRNGPVPSLILMVGDQIYADATAGVFDTQTPRDRVLSRYHTAWSSTNFARLAGAVPHCLALDDHEIWDNFEPSHVEVAPDPGEIRRKEALEWARLAFHTFQASISSAPQALPQIGMDEDFHHEFEVGGFPFFVMDGRLTRERRNLDTGQVDYRMIGPRQTDALLTWLKLPHADDLRPRFIVCGSVLAPFWKEGTIDDSYRRRDDGWNGYRSTMLAVLDCIVKHGIQNVVFLSGDYHCSVVTDLKFLRLGENIPVAEGLCITGSPFYAPIPFVNGSPDDYLMESEVTSESSKMTYTARSFSDCGGALQRGHSSITRVQVEPHASTWWIRVEVMDGATGTVVSDNPPMVLPRRIPVPTPD